MSKDFTIQITMEDMQVYLSAHPDAAIEVRLIAVCRMYGDLMEQINQTATPREVEDVER